MHRRWGFGAAVIAVACVASACLPGPDIRISTVAGTGNPGYNGDGQPATSANITQVWDVDVDSHGNVYIAEPRRVRRVDAGTGTITTVAGDGTTTFDGDDQPAVDAAVAPRAIALDADDNLYISETLFDRVRRVDATTGVISTVAGTGTRGSWTEEAEGQPATAVEIGQPTGIDVDAEGNLFVADPWSHMIRRVDAQTQAMTRVVGNWDGEELVDGMHALDVWLDDLTHIAVGPDGSIYFTALERIYEVDGATGIVTTFVGNGEWGFTGDGGPAADAQVSDPQDLVVDDAGNLYIGDGENGRVRLVTASTGIITTVVGSGEWGYDGDDQPALDAALSFPESLGLGPDGSLVLESDNRVRKVTVGGAIGGIVRDTANQNLVATTVELYAADDLTTPLATDATDANGWYGFSVRPGAYRVRFVGDAAHEGEWWADAASGASATTVEIHPGSLAGPTDAVTANANLADR